MLSTELARNRWPALPARHLRRHLRRRDLRCPAGGARRRDRAVAGLSLGRHPGARPADHLGGRLQRHRHHLSGCLSPEHDRRDHQGDSGRRRRQPVQSRSLLSAGRRHGARRRASATPSMSMPPSAGASAICTCCGRQRRSRRREEYVVAGWGSVNEDAQGPPIWDVVAATCKSQQECHAAAAPSVKFVRAGG